MKYPIIFSLLAIMLISISCKKDKPDTIENCRLKSVSSPSFFSPSKIVDIEYNDNGQIVAFTDSFYSNKRYKINHLYTNNANESILDSGLDFDNNIWTTNYIYHNDLLVEKSEFQTGLNLNICDLEKYRYDDQNRLEIYEFLRIRELNFIGPGSNDTSFTSQYTLKEKRFEYNSETELVVKNTYLGLTQHPYSHIETYSKNQGEANWSKCNLSLREHDSEGNIISTSERVFNFEYDSYPVIGSNVLERGSSLNAAFNNANNLIKLSGDNVPYDLSIVNDGFLCETSMGNCFTETGLDLLIDYVFDEYGKLIEYLHYSTPRNSEARKFYEYECD